MSSIAKTLAFVAAVAPVDAAFNKFLAKKLLADTPEMKALLASPVEVCVQTGSCLKVVSSDDQANTNSLVSQYFDAAVCDMQIKGSGSYKTGLDTMAFSFKENVGGSTDADNTFAQSAFFQAMEPTATTTAAASSSTVAAPRQLQGTETDAWAQYWQSLEPKAEKTGLRGSTTPAPSSEVYGATVHTAYVTFRNLAAFEANWMAAQAAAGTPKEDGAMWANDCAMFSNNAVSAKYGPNGGSYVTECNKEKDLITIKTLTATRISDVAVPELSIKFGYKAKQTYMKEGGAVQKCLLGAENHSASVLGATQEKLVKGQSDNKDLKAPAQIDGLSAELSSSDATEGLSLKKFDLNTVSFE